MTNYVENIGDKKISTIETDGGGYVTTGKSNKYPTFYQINNIYISTKSLSSLFLASFLHLSAKIPQKKEGRKGTLGEKVLSTLMILKREAKIEQQRANSKLVLCLDGELLSWRIF